MMSRLVVLFLTGALLNAVPVLAQDPVYDQSGGQYGRGYFAPLPFERIDTVTENVFLSFTDLSLPGNGGLGLSVVRSYNSRDGRWRLGLGGVPLRVIFNTTNLSDVDFVTADGAFHNAAGAGATTLTQGFWQFTKATRKLEMPNGLVFTYGHEPSTAGAYLTEIRDPFDNLITLSWQAGTGTLLSVTQHLGTHTRVVTFSGWVDDRATSMTFDGRTWTYTWQTISGSPSVQALTEMTPPGGTKWAFAYTNDASNAVKIQSLTTPNGGTVSYAWAWENFPTTPSTRIAIATRTTGGRSPAGTWSFNWQDTGRLLEITGPANIVRYWTIVQDDVPVKSQKVVKDLGDNVLETEYVTYETVPHPFNPVPAVKTTTLIRDGVTYLSTFTYATNDWANYGQPTQIVESAGGLTRTTVMTYQHGFSKYIRGRIASVATTVGADTTIRSFTYNMTTGFMTASTEQGLTTTFAANAQGNVESTWDVDNHRTDFTYDWGAVNSVSSPVSTVAVTRTINADGTVATETSTGTATTTYSYDGAGRVTSVASSTPGRVPVTTAYNVVGQQWVSTTTTRGGVSVTTDLDGWGRATHTQDSTGAQSRVVFDGAGRVTYQSRPYGTGVTEVGDSFTYDALGRGKRTTRPDLSWVETHYNGLSLGLQESLSGSTTRSTTQHFQWIAPGDGRLWRVVDAIGGDWRYDYNDRGQLTTVWKNADATAPTRTWTYDTWGRVTSMTQPEAGTSTTVYNGAGDVIETQDARGTGYKVAYTYDASHRVTFVNAKDTAEDVTTTYDTSGRVATVGNGTAQTTLAYDTSSRVTARTDVIQGRAFAQTFVYDGYDNLIQANYPLSGRKVFYDFDTQQRLVGVRTQVGSGTIKTLATGFVYRGDGALASYQYGNGQTASVTQDTRQRPLNWVNGPLNLTYAYDHVGNVTSIADVRGASKNGTFNYDLLDRITNSTVGGVSTAFTYTGSGDRLTQGTVNFNYNANRQLSSLSGGASGTFTYDAIGSLTADPSGAAYSYSAMNQIKASTVSGQTTAYQYGPGGMRAVKTGPDGIPHLFVYGSGGGPIAEYKLEGGELVLIRETVYLGSQLLTSFSPANITPPPMTVAIATPSDNTTLANGQSITLTATVTLGPGITLARVEYYARGVLVGQSTTGPLYSKTWTNTPLPPGSFIFHARAVATNGQAVASTPITVVVQ